MRVEAGTHRPWQNVSPRPPYLVFPTRLRTVCSGDLLHSFGIKSRTRWLRNQSATTFSLTEIVYANPHASWEKNPAEAGLKGRPLRPKREVLTSQGGDHSIGE